MAKSIAIFAKPSSTPPILPGYGVNLKLLVLLNLRRLWLLWLRRRRARLHAQVAQVYIDIDAANDRVRQTKRRIDENQHTQLVDGGR